MGEFQGWGYNAKTGKYSECFNSDGHCDHLAITVGGKEMAHFSTMEAAMDAIQPYLKTPMPSFTNEEDEDDGQGNIGEDTTGQGLWEASGISSRRYVNRRPQRPSLSGEDEGKPITAATNQPRDYGTPQEWENKYLSGESAYLAISKSIGLDTEMKDDPDFSTYRDVQDWYSSGGDDWINGYLKGEPQPQDDYSTLSQTREKILVAVDVIDKLIYSQKPYSSPIIVFRGVEERDFRREQAGQTTIIIHDGFLSTATSQEVAMGFAEDKVVGNNLPMLMKILIPDGIPCLKVESSIHSTSEKELLYPSGTIFHVLREETIDMPDSSIDKKLIPVRLLSGILSIPSQEDSA